MGCYINPACGSKESFLAQYHILANNDSIKSGKIPTYLEIISRNNLPVVLINNGPFTAAGVAFNEREYRAFTYAEDTRSRVLFEVPARDLLNVSDISGFVKFCPDNIKYILMGRK